MSEDLTDNPDPDIFGPRSGPQGAPDPEVDDVGPDRIGMGVEAQAAADAHDGAADRGDADSDVADLVVDDVAADDLIADLLAALDKV